MESHLDYTPLFNKQLKVSNIYRFLTWLALVDSVYFALVSLIPTTGNEDLVLALCDSSCHFVGKAHRYEYAVAIFLYRLYALVINGLCLANDYQWLFEADRMFQRLDNTRIGPEMYRLARSMAYCAPLLALVLWTDTTVLMVYRMSANKQYHCLLVNGLSIVFSTYTMGLSFSFDYILYRFSENLSAQLKHHAIVELKRDQPDLLKLYEQHSQFALIMNCFNQFLQKKFVCFAFMLMMYFPLYSIIVYSHMFWLLALVYILGAVAIFSLICLTTRIAGKPDTNLQIISKKIYYKYCIHNMKHHKCIAQDPLVVKVTKKPMHFSSKKILIHFFQN